MIKVSEAVIVEGKYDKIKLSSVIDGLIIETNGFRIFKDKEKRAYIKLLAEKNGVIILTDSDSAGFLIRNHIKGFVPPEKIRNVYIPEIKGKEPRKYKSSKEGTLGVEGVSAEIIEKAFEKAGILSVNTAASMDEKITKNDLYDIGLYGTDKSREKRERVKALLSLPRGLPSNAFLDALNFLFGKKDFENFLRENYEKLNEKIGK